MLDVEYNEVICLLDNNKGSKTTFFAFANTVETINFRKDNQGHGWIGIKYQHEPKSSANQINMHVNLKENDTILQQNTLGIIGINLIYAAYYYFNNINHFLESLMDNLSIDRIEINMLSLEGNLFTNIDNRIISYPLKIV